MDYCIKNVVNYEDEGLLRESLPKDPMDDLEKDSPPEQVATMVIEQSQIETIVNNTSKDTTTMEDLQPPPITNPTKNETNNSQEDDSSPLENYTVTLATTTASPLLDHQIGRELETPQKDINGEDDIDRGSEGGEQSFEKDWGKFMTDPIFPLTESGSSESCHDSETERFYSKVLSEKVIKKSQETVLTLQELSKQPREVVIFALMRHSGDTFAAYEFLIRRTKPAWSLEDDLAILSRDAEAVAKLLKHKSTEEVVGRFEFLEGLCNTP